ncbi:MAG: hypothetical protein GKR89_31145 [Candidatus Latescibacteria bacterium]|nr:hypothetical protein [Candidatus Latescibacterota bacterium]
MPNALSRRERQIMDIIYRLGQASAEDIRQRLTGAPHNASVRTFWASSSTKDNCADTGKRSATFTPLS